jgi:hypothetical protein
MSEPRETAVVPKTFKKLPRLVTPQQFSSVGGRITHEPTGATFLKTNWISES